VGKIKSLCAKIKIYCDRVFLFWIVKCMFFFGLPALGYFYPKFIFRQGNIEF
jgi:hypothetical protein